MAKNISVLSLFAVVVFVAIFLYSQEMDLNLKNSTFVTGYILLILMLAVALFNSRKKLSMLPLGKASSWLVFHMVGGLLCMGMFWLHTKTLWPYGIYEGFLAGTFYLVSLSGILGYFIQKNNARKLTETEIEVIYERIPIELLEIREKVEDIILECAEKTGSDTLANHYSNTLTWFFQKPRFYWSTLFGSLTPIGVGKPTNWIHKQNNPVKKYLNDEELKYFQEIDELANLKVLVDRHFVYQDLNKKWLLFHVPLSVALVALAFWHLLLVEVYAR